MLIYISVQGIVQWL